AYGVQRRNALSRHLRSRLQLSAFAALYPSCLSATYGVTKLVSLFSVDILVCWSDKCVAVNRLCGGQDAGRDERTICYARVSSNHETNDLDRQRADLHARSPQAEIISDLRSGLLLERIYAGAVTRVAIEYNHRLCRCLWISQKHRVQLMVLNTSPSAEAYASSELTEDLLAAVNYFAAKHNDRRAAAYRRRRQQVARLIRLFPTKSQKETLRQWFGTQRYIYNRSVALVREGMKPTQKELRALLLNKYIER
ncbi:hypothetical protein V1517DRAFT_178742, partial [Lipomyces orientalis]